MKWFAAIVVGTVLGYALVGGGVIAYVAFQIMKGRRRRGA